LDRGGFQPKSWINSRIDRPPPAIRNAK
jgi:hypothetical protein